jgi:hypothetical protein
MSTLPEKVFLNSFSHGSIVVSIAIRHCSFLMGCRSRFRGTAPHEFYIPSMSRRNHAACIGDDCDAGEIIAGRSLLAQFGLTPKSKRGLAARDPGEAVDALNAL